MSPPFVASSCRHKPNPPPQLLRSQGFTLFELVMVLVILAILAALIIPRYVSFVEKSRQAVAQSATADGIARFRGAYTRYLSDTNKKPTTLEDLGSTEYLNLDGSGKVNTGSYDLLYVLKNDELTISAFNKGDTTLLANATIPWPN